MKLGTPFFTELEELESIIDLFFRIDRDGRKARRRGKNLLNKPVRWRGARLTLKEILEKFDLAREAEAVLEDAQTRHRQMSHPDARDEDAELIEADELVRRRPRSNPVARLVKKRLAKTLEHVHESYTVRQRYAPFGKLHDEPFSPVEVERAVETIPADIVLDVMLSEGWARSQRSEWASRVDLVPPHSIRADVFGSALDGLLFRPRERARQHWPSHELEMNLGRGSSRQVGAVEAGILLKARFLAWQRASRPIEGLSTRLEQVAELKAFDAAVAEIYRDLSGRSLPDETDILAPPPLPVRRADKGEKRSPLRGEHPDGSLEDDPSEDETDEEDYAEDLLLEADDDVDLDADDDEPGEGDPPEPC